ncbi:membrane protein insertase YidC [Psychrobacter sp. FDAARGOS_221]|uniref:membrane protein insertase YidC n=1 Tax=Psychrobacter sp. FDAARGOS_221 TaxID=1975705 RepID=UPI000BB57B77|nr:membrane protein insertase YidC [Psychrobacter sp. FDAARGOS_221]PNK60763.1 membrane protein insertase YidC [Psychrobacter sp. FDAARGOS_221]
MQKILRVLIIIAMLITAYLLVLAWQKDYANAPAPSADAVTPSVSTSTGSDIPTSTGVSDSDIPVATVSDQPNTQGVSEMSQAQSGELIDVTTDRYHVKIDPQGGNVVYAALRDYDATLDSEQPFVLLENSSERVYIAQSGLIDTNNNGDGIDKPQSPANYSYQSSSYSMQDGQETLEVPLVYRQDGLRVTKTFTFTRGKYPISVNYNVNNTTGKDWNGTLFAQLKRDSSKDPGMGGKGALSMATYLGGAWGTPDDEYNKLKFKNFNDDELNASSNNGWVGIVQHYFVSAWTPENFTGKFFSRETANGDYIIGMLSQPIMVPADKQANVTATLYAGPKVQKELGGFAPGFEKTVDYGWAWPISKFLFLILSTIHSVVGNWGWAIIGLTLSVKLALMWISHKSYYSMAKMRALAPRLAALKEEHGDDRMKMSQEMMAIYKEEKVNPMAGCLPILLQMPIFLGLYYMLVESVELRHAPWILWIQDLSSMDPWFILPILMGASMFAQQSFSPQPTDPMQAKVMKFLPIIFTLFMLFFPAGLVLYWTVNNLFTMGQQFLVNKQVEKEQREKAANMAS